MVLLSQEEINVRSTQARGMLRPYQLEVLDRMKQDKRHLNYLDMGMGKGIVTLLSIVEAKALPCIILSNKAAMGVLENELDKWFGLPSVIYAGKPKQRDLAWKRYIEEGHSFIIANYAMAEELAERFGLRRGNKLKKHGNNMLLKTSIHPPGTVKRPQALMCDEIHTAGLFNHKNKTYGIIKDIAAQIEYCYLLTGTPYRKGVVDLFGPLSIVAPQKFDSYWKYVNRHCVTIDTGFGKAIERNPADATQFRQMLRQYATIMRKQDYLHDLPEKIRSVVPVLMNQEQQRVYDELTEEMFAETDGGDLIMTPSILALMIRQRQLLACPQELGLKERGAAIDAIIEMTEDLYIEDKPFVIFTPFRKAVKWVKEAILAEYPGTPIYEITGGLTEQEFTNTWKGFQGGPSTTQTTETGFRVLICVIKSSAAFHATAAANAFFLGCEYDFNQNAQAEDRLYRIGQKKVVNCYYLLHRNTVDDDVVQILNDKTFSSDVVLAPDDVYQKMIQRRTKE